MKEEIICLLSNFTKIANAHNTGVANVIIRYLLCNNIVVLCTSTKEERMKTNQNVSFKLTDEEIKEIKSMDKKNHFSLIILLLKWLNK